MLYIFLQLALIGAKTTGILPVCWFLILLPLIVWGISVSVILILYVLLYIMELMDNV